MIILMSREGPEVLVGEMRPTTRDGLHCKIIAINQHTGMVELEWLDGPYKGRTGEYYPSIVGCYALFRSHPGDSP